MSLISLLGKLFTPQERLKLYIDAKISVGIEGQDKFSFRVFNSKEDIIHELHGIEETVYKETYEFLSTNHDKYVMSLIDNHRKQAYHFAPELPFNYVNPIH